MSIARELAKTEDEVVIKARLAKTLEALENQASRTPQMVQIELLDELGGLMEDLIKVVKEGTTSEGILEQLTQSVDSSITELTPKNIITMPWDSIQILNDGPGAYSIAINKDYIDGSVFYKPNEPFEAKMGRGKIRKILLQASPGTTVSLRIAAVK